MNRKPGDIVVVLRPERPERDPTGPDRWTGLRLILKGLLRRHGWRCVDLAPIAAVAQAQGQGPGRNLDTACLRP